MMNFFLLGAPKRVLESHKILRLLLYYNGEKKSDQKHRFHNYVMS